MAARARIRLTLTVIATAALAGACDLLAPTPDRFVSDAAWALRIDTLPIHGLQPGQHIARRVTITPDFGGIADRVFAVLLQVDTTIVVQGVVSPWRLEFDARLWPSGPHLVAVGALLLPPAGGLAASVNVPTFWQTTTIVVDHTPPTPGRVDSVVWRNGHPTLFWPENQDANFYAYVVDRTGNWARQFIVGGGVDSLFDRHTTTWTDTAVATVYGLQLTYRAWVTNGDSTALGDSTVLRLGTTVPVHWTNRGPPVTSTATGETYLLADYGIDTLFALTSSGTVARRLVIAMSDGLALSADGTRLFIPKYNANPMTVLDAATFAVVATWTPPAGASTSGMVAGRAGRVYLPSADSTVAIVNAATGALIGRIPANPLGGFLAIAPDGGTLYVMHQPVSGSPLLVDRVDVTTDAPPAPSTRLVDEPRTDITDLQVSATGTRLFVVCSWMSDSVRVLDATTLATVGFLPAPGGVREFRAAPDAVYLSELRSDPHASGHAGRVTRYDPATLGALGTWDFVEAIQGVAATGNGHGFIAFGSFATWFVPLP